MTIDLDLLRSKQYVTVIPIDHGKLRQNENSTRNTLKETFEYDELENPSSDTVTETLDNDHLER